MGLPRRFALRKLLSGFIKYLFSVKLDEGGSDIILLVCG
jgi:hypothetical protein